MGNCLPWGSGPEGNGNVIAYRDDAGWFEAVCRVDEDGVPPFYKAVEKVDAAKKLAAEIMGKHGKD